MFRTCYRFLKCYPNLQSSPSLCINHSIILYSTKPSKLEKTKKKHKSKKSLKTKPDIPTVESQMSSAEFDITNPEHLKSIEELPFNVDIPKGFPQPSQTHSLLEQPKEIIFTSEEEKRIASLQGASHWTLQRVKSKRKASEESLVPRKKLSFEEREQVRNLHQSDPEKYTVKALAKQFHVPKWDIMKILKSKFKK